MANRINLDMDVLRTFVTGFELGSFTRAADRLGRSQSAVSTQLRKLEDQIGQPLFKKAGRQLALTTAGESLLSYAKRLLELNDETVDTIRGSDLEGWVRLGLPQDLAETWLPAVLARFSLAHPKVRIEVLVDRSAHLVEKTIKGELDMSLAWGDGSDGPHAERVADFAVAWIGRPDWPGLRGEALPLAFFAPPCVFRSAGIAALDSAGIAWRLVFTSPSLSGLWAAAEAGLGITVRAPISLPVSLAVLDAAALGLPKLAPMPLALHRAEAEPSPAVARLMDILLDTLSKVNGYRLPG
jgi:DNA-binding transcriptional LysR family regulator